MKVLKVLNHRLVGYGVEFKILVEQGLFFKKQSITFVHVSEAESYFVTTGQNFSIATPGFSESVRVYRYMKYNPLGK